MLSSSFAVVLSALLKLPPIAGKDAVTRPDPGDDTRAMHERDRVPAREVLSPRNGAHVRTGLVFIPGWVLSRFLRSYSNALCRREVGSQAASPGTNRSDACNFYVQMGYRRWSAPLTWDVGLSYIKFSMPDSNWLARGEQIPAADFTQVRLHVLALQVGVSRDFAIGKTGSLRWTWQIGGQFGVGTLLGNVYRTKLGAQMPDCRVDTLGDLEKCSPYRALEFDEPTRKRRYFAECSNATGCDESDLVRAGRMAEGKVPRIIPTAQIISGPRVELQRGFSLAAELGIGLGIGIGLALDWKTPSASMR